MRRIKPLLCCLGTIIIISGLAASSSQSMEDSNRASKRVADAVYKVYLRLLESSVESEAQTLYKINRFVRKGAHFFIFALLSLFLVMASKLLRIRKLFSYILVLLVVTLIAAADEYHQSFTGRGASFSDVMLDVYGYLAVLGIDAIKELILRMTRKLRKA